MTFHQFFGLGLIIYGAFTLGVAGALIAVTVGSGQTMTDEECKAEDAEQSRQVSGGFSCSV